MEVFIASSILLGVAILIWMMKFVNSFWLRPKKLEKQLRQQGFSGNSYRFLYGDLKENVMMIKQAKSKPINLTDDIVPRVTHFTYQTVKNYGKKSFIWLGPIPRVQIMNPEDIKEILTKMHDFQKPDSNPMSRLIAIGLANVEGEKWVLHRKLLTPAFHQEKLKDMLPAFEESCNGMIGKWEKLVVSEEGSFEVDVWPHLSSLTSDAISRTAFGSSYEEGKEIFQLQDEQTQLTVQVLQSLYIPGLRFVPTKRNKRMWEIERKVRASLKGIIDKRLSMMKDGKTANDDLLGILLESNLGEIKDGGKVGMSMDDVIEECKLFYFAGQETTSVLLVWTMVLLAQHPEWQSRAREEVLTLFGDDKPTFEGLNRLKTVTMILYEVLRLYPPGIALARSLHKETKLGNVTLPRGVQVLIPIILLHHDPEYWGDDVKEFKPERFAQGVSNATKNQACFFPFGGGPRICIGQNFAMLEAKLAVAMILKHFWFELSPLYTHAPFPVITLQPQHGAHIILHKL